MTDERLRIVAQHLTNGACDAGPSGDCGHCDCFGQIPKIAEALLCALDGEGDAKLPRNSDCPNCVTPWKCNGPHIITPTPAGDSDPADYGPATPDGAEPETTACRNCGRMAIDHTKGRYSIYGVCPAPAGDDTDALRRLRDDLAAERHAMRVAVLERDEALVALDRVRALHQPVDRPAYAALTMHDGEVLTHGMLRPARSECIHDRYPWPCPTVAALDTGEGDQ